MTRTGLIAVMLLATVFCADVFAETGKVLFFEAALAPTDMIFSSEPSGYSKLADLLRNDGMLLASMSSGEITREKLSPYEIVVLHPSPERPFGNQEISALAWFVAQKGGALFVHGGTAKVVNPLTGIFGISIDSSNLVDTSSAMAGSSAGRDFVLTTFPNRSDFGFSGIETIGFYGGPPLMLSKDAVAVVTGDADCYSEDGLYGIGSFPPVAAVSYLGRGVVLVKSDRSMLNNANIEAYQNMDWAKAIFETLAATKETQAERDQSLIGLRSQVEELESKLNAAGERFNKYEADLAGNYAKIKDLQGQLEATKQNNEQLGARLETVQDERDDLRGALSKYSSPDVRKTAAIVAAAVLILAFMVGLFVGRMSARPRV